MVDHAAPGEARKDPYIAPGAKLADAAPLPVRGWRRAARVVGWVVAWFVIFVVYWLAATLLVNATSDLAISQLPNGDFDAKVSAPFGLSGPAWQGACLLALLVVPAALGRLASGLLDIRGPVAFLVPAGVFVWGYFSSTTPYVRGGAFDALFVLVALLVLAVAHRWRAPVPG
jgi:hypothetical protein